MKTFLAAWLAEAPKVFRRELAAAVELRPSSQLPDPEAATALSIESGKPEPGKSQASQLWSGRFLVTVDGGRLQTLLAAARAAGALIEDDLEFWKGLMRSIAVAATEAAASGAAGQASISVKDGEWKPGLPAAAWELRLGGTTAPLAFIDEMESVATAGESVAAPGSAASPPGSQFAPGGIELLLGVELRASLRFGSREMTLNEVLGLGAGDVVELDRNVADPVDLLVGDKIVARGEVVLVNGSFGLRTLEIAEPKKRLENIRCLF